MKLVKFEDGTYGIRRWWFFGWFFNSLNNSNYAHKNKKEVREFCKGTQEQCLIMIKRILYNKTIEDITLNTKHKVVK